jgi:hypothetical protein
MFLIAMHLMYKRKKNPNLSLPNDLPLELRVPAYEDENTFAGQTFMTSAPTGRQTEIAPKTRLGDLLGGSTPA